MSSYARHGNHFTKTNYDWFSIPIVSPINFNRNYVFKLKNLGIKDSCFLVGIIKERAFLAHMRMPWKTDNVICF